MIKPAAVLLLALALTTTAVSAEELPNAQDLVAAADKVRNPGQPFRVTSTLTEYVGGSARDKMVLVVFSREDKTSGQFSNLVRYAEPARDQGKLVLLDGTRMWFYDPASKASIRISPQQRLIGQASNGDVMTVNFAHDYKATMANAESLQDADHHQRDCWHLDLVAATADAIYSRIEYWIEKDSAHPIKGKFYSDSGRLLKIAYFRKYEEQLGGARPTETIIIDAVDPNLVTTMSTSDFRPTDIPDAWFQRDFLPRLRVDQ
ncbi:outer membrane lipoprotein-sorting protein [Telmatospirillum sp.]|uniref:outer membrane lipoprotein-sorting protein n=1 Tax=Telmatospirillum sp. TaxID=2079197 RepID=UPI00283E6906|nr:outer membrane lipoprotein-sorting protein [Telmatospirillum sp.]MDR3439420.1 outer membrane lipoprotein-sorting protein [Telmatospirillum sp.]